MNIRIGIPLFSLFLSLPLPLCLCLSPSLSLLISASPPVSASLFFALSSINIASGFDVFFLPCFFPIFHAFALRLGCLIPCIMWLGIFLFYALTFSLLRLRFPLVSLYIYHMHFFSLSLYSPKLWLDCLIPCLMCLSYSFTPPTLSSFYFCCYFSIIFRYCSLLSLPRSLIPCIMLLGIPLFHAPSLCFVFLLSFCLFLLAFLLFLLQFV